MTTLTVYFASSPKSPSSSSSSSTNTSITTTIQPIRINQNLTKLIPIPSAIPANITIPTETSPPIQTPSTSRTPSKRNKTFFERFDQTTPSTLLSNPQSPTNHQHQHQHQQQQQQSTDYSNPSIDPPPRLRRRFTFRRSFRHSVHNKGGDVDDGIRSVLSLSFVNFSLCRYLFYAPSK